MMIKKDLPDLKALPKLTEDEIDDAMFRIRDRIWAELADLYLRYNEESGLSYADVGRRIRRSRSQVQRWLGAPINMTLSSAGLLAEALAAEPDFKLRLKAGSHGANRAHPCEEARAQLVYTTSVRVKSPAAKPVYYAGGDVVEDLDVASMASDGPENVWVLND
jgi:hypothetical protein